MSRAHQFFCVVMLPLGLTFIPSGHAQDKFLPLRQQMMQEITALTRSDRLSVGKEALDARVIDAMGRVPRHQFVPTNLQTSAYENRPLPIGHGQTISQPYIVAIMTDLMQVGPEDVVLEIGTGSGYQAAILSELVAAVYTIEIIEPLARQAQKHFQNLGYKNVQTKVGDGYYGWEEHGPYNAIIVTAAASHVPPPLVRQLKPHGKMVIPVGAPFLIQHLMVVEKKADGTVSTRQILPVQFVPLVGSH